MTPQLHPPRLEKLAWRQPPPKKQKLYSGQEQNNKQIYQVKESIIAYWLFILIQQPPAPVHSSP